MTAKNTSSRTLQFPITAGSGLLVLLALLTAAHGAEPRMPVVPLQPWTRFPQNPVYSNHPTNPEMSFVGDPGVLYYNGTFYMWYASLLHFNIPDAVAYGPCNFTPPFTTCALPMGLATSTDGTTWRKFDRGTADLKDDYVLLRDSPDSWDSLSVETPTVLFDEPDGKDRSRARKSSSFSNTCSDTSEADSWSSGMV